MTTWPTKLVLSLCLIGALSQVVSCVGSCDAVCEPYYYGYYYDSPVSGLSYAAEDADGTMMTGVTGEDGEAGRFIFLEGKPVTFSIGDTVVGTSLAKERMTPFDFVELDEEAIGGCEADGELPTDASFRIIHNLVVLLQSLDLDGDPAEKIEISSDVAALFEGLSLNFDQPWESFKGDADLKALLDQANKQDLLDGIRTLVERKAALSALYRGIGLCGSTS